jgi:hypothetical protein
MESLARDDDPGWFDPNTVFVVMPFNKGLNKIYACIKEECTRLGLIARRADEIPGSGRVAEEIRESLERAEFIICDLSIDRPNVYYELGLAQGVGNEPLDIFLIAKEGTDLHFDVESFRVRYYRSTRDLRVLIRTQFVEMVKARRKKEKEAASKKRKPRRPTRGKA